MSDWKEVIRAAWAGADNYMKTDIEQFKPKREDASWTCGTLAGIEHQIETARAEGMSGPMMAFYMTSTDDGEWLNDDGEVVGKRKKIEINKIAVVV